MCGPRSNPGGQNQNLARDRAPANRMEDEMGNKILAIAAALAVSLTVNTTAEAGSGVRLGFGGPLGHFKATPARGAVSHKSARASSKKAARLKAAKRTAAAKRAAAKKAAERKAKIRTARRARQDDQNRKIRAERKIAKAATETTAPKTSESKETGAKALIRTKDKAVAASKPVTLVKATPATETVTVTETKKPEKDEATLAESKETSSTELGCKKFIPAVGVTISVGCGD
jgi:hypothetical protein